MRNTTLCYIERGEQYLMLHRVKKEHDLNHDKWVGIGGKFERDETPDDHHFSSIKSFFQYH